MFRNYLIIALRNLKKYKIYSFINIFGLAIGLACCLLILLYIKDELSFDNFHSKADRIYRINSDLKFGSTELHIPATADMMGEILKKDYPEVEEYTRLYGFWGNKFVRSGNEYNNEVGIGYADSTFFKVFDFEIISGSKTSVLNEPNTVVISEKIARKYFGTTNCAGRYLETNDNGSTMYKIAAVIKDMPQNSHFSFNFIFPMHNLHYDWGNFVSLNFHTYLVLKEGTDYKKFEKNFRQYNIRYAFPYAQKFMNISSLEDFERAGNRLDHSLIPLRDIHLYSNRAQEIKPTGTIEYVYIFGFVAAFILLIACINFMNLTTARSAGRAREVGIRKVLGSVRKGLITQFLVESILLSAISVAFAVLITYYAIPWFNFVSGKEIEPAALFSPWILAIIAALTVVTGIAAGSYPSFYLSKFIPGEILKGKLKSGTKSGGLRSALVIFQFAASVILISATLIIYNQLNYIQNKNLGYQKDQLLVLNDTYTLGNNAEVFKNEMLKTPGVIKGTISSFLPIPSDRNFNGFFTDPAATGSSGLTMQSWVIDYDYMETLGIKVLKGRAFSEEFGSDSSAVILNESAVKKLGYTEPVGSKLYTYSHGVMTSYNVIGVVKNFNFESLHQEVGPQCFLPGRSTGKITFKVSATHIPQIINAAEKKWREMASGMPFNYQFMDDAFDDIYKAEKRIGMLALSFSSLAIIIACLGLFGLATFLAEQKTKEIGIRKTLGASASSIIIMLSKEFVKWVLIANIIAWPAAYYCMNKWLQDFAYRIDINIWLFVISGGAALIIALATVIFQAFKAAGADPVKSLKYE